MSEDRPDENPEPVAKWKIAVGLVAVAAIGSTCLGDTGDTSGPDDTTAHVICQQFVKDRLKAPATARFPLTYEASISNVGDLYTVRSHVDAQNSFGAQIRTGYTCKVRYSGDDNWRLIQLDME